MNVEINLLTNAITETIKNRFGLDAVWMTIISTLTISVLTTGSRILSNLNVERHILAMEMSDAKYYFNAIIFYGIFAGIFYGLYKARNVIVAYFDVKKEVVKEAPVIELAPGEAEPTYYTIDISNIKPLLIAVNKYINLHPEFFESNISKRLVDFTGEELYYVYAGPLIFNDTLHNVRGYIETEYKEIATKESMVKLFNMVFYINAENKNKKCYTKQIEEHINYSMKHGDIVKLNYYKVLTKSLITHTFYNRSINIWKDDIVTLENEFFSSHKKYLFSIMKEKASFKDSNNWNNLILHGAPGCGKSSFIYRLATYLKMSIISIDLSLYIDKKKELYAIFHGQEFHLPMDDANKFQASKNAIIVLEEFDQCIDKLIQVEEIFKFKELITKNFFQKKSAALKQKMAIEYKEPGETDEPQIKENMNYMDYAKADMDSSRKKDNDLISVNADIAQIIKNINEDNKSDILRLGDMLELFQGPIPIKDRIIIATTNHYHKIKNTLPALFRAGRLTPIEFTYLDWTSLNELCRYYFGQEMTGRPIEITVATSEIIEIAVKHRAAESTFAEFEANVRDAVMLKNLNGVRFKRPTIVEVEASVGQADIKRLDNIRDETPILMPNIIIDSSVDVSRVDDGVDDSVSQSPNKLPNKSNLLMLSEDIEPTIKDLKNPNGAIIPYDPKTALRQLGIIDKYISDDMSWEQFYEMELTSDDLDYESRHLLEQEFNMLKIMQNNAYESRVQKMELEHKYKNKKIKIGKSRSFDLYQNFERNTIMALKTEHGNFGEIPKDSHQHMDNMLMAKLETLPNHYDSTLGLDVVNGKRNDDTLNGDASDKLPIKSLKDDIANNESFENPIYTPRTYTLEENIRLINSKLDDDSLMGMLY